MNNEAIQRSELTALLSRGERTAYGKGYNFESLEDYREYRENVPIQFYRDLPVEQLKNGEADILWPGEVHRFAISAGTSGKGKHIPITDERLQSDRQFMRELAFNYFRQRPNVFRLMGSHLSLPGSIERNENVLVGEISGFTGLQIPYWLRPFQLFPPDKLVQLNFKEKFELVLEKAVRKNIKAIIAVPSWILTLFQEALKRTGKKSIADLWPGLQLLVCGGVKLANYRPHLRKLLGDINPDFLETYGASEGYFAYTDDLSRNDLKLVIDNGVYYEFIPDPLPDEESLGIQPACSLWEVEPGIPYAMVITSNTGLWRYALRDIITFTSINPPRIKVEGRISGMLDDYGEGLYVYEAEKALQDAVRQMNLEKSNFTIAARLPSESEVPYHQWFIQFVEPVHADTLKRLAKQIDQQLQQKNRHYAIRRESGALGMPQIRSISQNDINRWLEESGKSAAQSKLPKVIHENIDLLS